MISLPPPQRFSREAGFTLTELLVASGVMVLALLGILALFDLNRGLARSQTMVSDLQQSVRVAQNEIVQDLRMAGRGGLGRGTLPGGVAVSVRNDVPDTGNESHISTEDDESHTVLVGSDVLTVRGVFSTPIYHARSSVGAFVLDDPDDPKSGTLLIENPVPNTGVPQDLQYLVKAKASDALLLVSPLASVAVVEITGVTQVNSEQVRIAFAIGSPGGTDTKDRYASLTGGFPISLRTVAHAGLLEEYRYYVRRDFAVAGATSGDLAPKLTRARFLPGTETLYETASWEDVADNVFDLQIALGIDRNSDEVIGETEDGAGDDWLFNSADDSDSDGNPVQDSDWNPTGTLPRLYYVRLTTVARTDLRDPDYQAPILTRIEDKSYGEDPHTAFNSRAERMYRRRMLTTVVDLRNVS